jgi:hypothetical protein
MAGTPTAPHLAVDLHRPVASSASADKIVFDRPPIVVRGSPAKLRTRMAASITLQASHGRRVTAWDLQVLPCPHPGLASLAVAATRTKRTPVRGRNTRDWQPRFLRTLAATGNVSLACQAAKVGRTRAYEARQRDEDFAVAWHEALEDACDELESEARRRALAGSDQLLMFLLRSHRPERYRENYRVEHSAPADAPVPVKREVFVPSSDEWHAEVLKVAAEAVAARPRKADRPADQESPLGSNSGKSGA